MRKIELCHNDVILNEEVVKMAETHPLLEELNFKHTSSDEDLVKKLDKKKKKKSVKLHLNQFKGKFI